MTRSPRFADPWAGMWAPKSEPSRYIDIPENNCEGQVDFVPPKDPDCPAWPTRPFSYFEKEGRFLRMRVRARPRSLPAALRPR